jgi:hypothetical protein
MLAEHIHFPRPSDGKKLETSNNLLFGRKEPGIRPLRRWLIAGGQRLAVGPLR